MLLALALQLATVADAIDAYESCVRLQAVKLGAFSRDDARTVTAAARGACASQWREVRAAYPGPAVRLAALQARISDRATLDILEARNGPGGINRRRR